MSATATPHPIIQDTGLVTEAKVLHAVQRIVARADPLWIAAFGSRARGTHTPDSDLDLAVMLSQYDPYCDPLPIHRSELDKTICIDLLVFGKERHEFMKDSIISVHHDIANEGVVLYDKRIGSVDLGAVERITR